MPDLNPFPCYLQVKLQRHTKYKSPWFNIKWVFNILTMVLTQGCECLSDQLMDISSSYMTGSRIRHTTLINKSNIFCFFLFSCYPLQTITSLASHMSCPMMVTCGVTCSVTSQHMRSADESQVSLR